MDDDEDTDGGRQPKGRMAALLVLMTAIIVVYAIFLIKFD